MVQQKIPFPETLKDIHPFAQGFHDGGHKWGVPQFRGVIPFENGHEPTRRDRTLDGVKVMGLEAQGRQKFATDGFGAIG